MSSMFGVLFACKIHMKVWQGLSDHNILAKKKEIREKKKTEKVRNAGEKNIFAFWYHLNLK